MGTTDQLSFSEIMDAKSVEDRNLTAIDLPRQLKLPADPDLNARRLLPRTHPPKRQQTNPLTPPWPKSQSKKILHLTKRKVLQRMLS